MNTGINRSISLLLSTACLASCSVDQKEAAYACHGVTKEFFQLGNQEHESQESIAVVLDGSIRLEGKSVMLPIRNLISVSQKDERSILSICGRSSTQIDFNNYGCDFLKNVERPFDHVTEGSINFVLGKLYIHQYRFFKPDVPQAQRNWGWRKIGEYQCEKK